MKPLRQFAATRRNLLLGSKHHGAKDGNALRDAETESPRLPIRAELFVKSGPLFLLLYGGFYLPRLREGHVPEFVSLAFVRGDGKRAVHDAASGRRFDVPEVYVLDGFALPARTDLDPVGIYAHDVVSVSGRL